MFADISNEMLIRWYNRYRGDNNVDNNDRNW